METGGGQGPSALFAAALLGQDSARVCLHLNSYWGVSFITSFSIRMPPRAPLPRPHPSSLRCRLPTLNTHFTPGCHLLLDSLPFPAHSSPLLEVVPMSASSVVLHMPSSTAFMGFSFGSSARREARCMVLKDISTFVSEGRLGRPSSALPS